MHSGRAPWSRDRSVWIIVNPASHNALRDKHRAQINEWLATNGWAVEWRASERPGHATEIAAEAARAGTPLVLVAGGDGALNEVINGLADTATAVGVIPTGTVNLWARELGIRRKKPAVAVEQSLTGDCRRIDLGRAGGRYFHSMASYGIDAAVTAGVSNRLKGIIGAAAYAVASFWAAIRFRSYEYTLELDDERVTMRVLMVIASNTREYAGITQINTDAIVDDGLLDVRIFEGHGRLNIALHALRVLLRLHRRAKKVHFRRVRRLVIHGDPPLPLQLDGDYAPGLAQVVSCEPGALLVAVPSNFKSPLFSRPPGS